MEEYIKQLKQRVSGYLYLHDERERGELEYWDSGNFDDAFESGIEVGIAIALLQVIADLEGGEEE